MALSENEKIIKNYLLFISVRENKTIEEKIMKIRKHLDEGADINAADANNNNNTALHIAVKRGEKDIVQLLIANRASVIKTNSAGKTPLDLAKELETNNKKEIVDILSAGPSAPPEYKGMDSEITETSSNEAADAEEKKSHPKDLIKERMTASNDKPYKYQKRTGTSGVSGQLYETKLLSLVLLRALIDADIEEFYLGTNISRIGALDDICLRYKVKGQAKPIMLFLQAKHREDRESHRLTVADVQNSSGDFSLAKYLDSYLRIKEYFDPKSKDDMFVGEFHDVECNFIIYTPVRDSFDKKLKGQNRLSAKINYLIETNTQGEMFQYNYNSGDVDALTTIVIKERIKILGQTFLHFIFSKKSTFQYMMTDELMKRYHVVLALKVIDVSELEPKKKLHRDGNFRSSFFTSDEEFLITLQETFYKGLSTKRYDQKDMKGSEIITQISRFTQNPCGNTLSRLIGNVVSFDDKTYTLKLIDSTMLRKELKQDAINKINAELKNRFMAEQKEITPHIVKDAIRLKLESHKFQLPPTFGNIDLHAKGKRLGFLANKLIELFNTTNNKNVIEINDDIVGPNKLLQQGVVDINGGVGGAVGNLLVLDEESKMMKFDIHKELPENAKKLLEELITRLNKDDDLSRYRININIDGFPKVSFHGDEYDRRQAKDFLSKIWFYTFQGQETDVERILKKEIDNNYNNDKGKNEFVFRIHSDAIYLRSHDEIQKWWMLTSEAPYLTKKSELFNQAKKDVIDSPLLTVLNLMYINKIKKMGIEYNKNGIRPLQLDNFEELLCVITNANMFTGIKMFQHFRHFDNYSLIDFDYVISLPLNDYNTMIWELGESKIKTLIIMYENHGNSEESCSKLLDIIKIFKEQQTTSNKHIQRNIIIVTDKLMAAALKKHLPNEYNAVEDKNSSLNYLTIASQEKIKKLKIIFQGEQVTLETILDSNSEKIINPEILLKLINNEVFEIGQVLTDANYDEIKDFYVDRYLTRDETCQVNTLNDIGDDIVLITAKSGMGLSTLLTHLSIKTKEVDPSVWISRINLLEHTKEFARWHNEKIEVDRFETIKFISKALLKNNNKQTKFELGESKGKIILLHEEDIKGSTLLELELFIYYYNSRRITILLDDFHGINPHYDKEAIKLVNHLKHDNIRTWIACCSYNNSKILLQREFGVSYTLEPFSIKGSKNFLSRFFNTNLRLEKLNQDQFENVLSFMEFMVNERRVRDLDREWVPVLSLLFHLIYIVAVQFFQSEINRITPKVFHEKVKQNLDIDINKFSLLDEYLERIPQDEQQVELASTPLHLYVAANYFKCEIEDRFAINIDKEEIKKKWDIAVNTFTLYKRFLEAYMNNLLFEGDDNISDHDVIDSYTDKHREFMSKYKKFGLYAIYKENDISKLLTEEDMHEIKNTMEKIETGVDRSGLVNCVINSIPKFGHLVLAQYFAVEGLMDVLKARSLGEVENPWKNEAIWHAILNILLFKSSPRVREAFDYKLKHDPVIAEMSSSEVCKKVVFELLLKQNTELGESSNTVVHNESILNEAINNGFLNIVNLILKSIEVNLDNDNLDDFVKLIYDSAFMFTAFSSEYKGLVDSVLNCIKNVDSDKLGKLISSGQLTEIPQRHVNLYLNSETATNLRTHLCKIYEQLPEITQTIQVMYNQSDNLGNLVSTILQCGLKNMFEAFTRPPLENESGSSDS